MTFDDYRASLSDAQPPAGMAPPLAALWWQGKGDWTKAHGIVQGETDAAAAWVHAHLHRVEGDLGNAGYWYARADKPTARGPLEEEWTAIVAALL
jgi:hypothetical protein